MRRKPLFPPPSNPATGKAKRHKGRQEYSVVTVNGRVRIRRVRWHDRQTGSETPMDRVLDESEQRISRGVRELVCRLNQCSSSFVLTAENLYRAAHIQLSKETARQLIEREAKGVLRQTQRGELAPEWEAEDCRSPQGTRRLYIGCDGVKVRVVTDEEKKQRRKKIRQKRRRRGRKCKPLGRAKQGADFSYKEFRVGYFYDESKQHRYVNVTSGNHEATGRMLSRMVICFNGFETKPGSR